MLIDRTPGDEYDASIRLFNSDGSEAELSGNGTRCAAALLAADRPVMAEFRIRTGAGVKTLRLISRDENEFLFEMNMGEPRVIELHATVHGHDAVVVDVGNPQCALPVDNFDFDWRRLGASIERDPRFANRTNVSFFRPAVRRAGEHSIEVRFWERGAGETNSSGTGSTGAAIAAIARGLVTSPVEIVTTAGTLHLRVEEYSPTQNCGTAYLTGPAVKVGEGVFYRARISR
jgi:diaminopimelate epimerase